MNIQELFGKTITNIYASNDSEQGWLDTADCFIELDYRLLIGFPYGFPEEAVWIGELNATAKSIFVDFSTYPTDRFARKDKPTGKFSLINKTNNHNNLNLLKKAIFGKRFSGELDDAGKISAKKADRQHVLGAKIVNFLWYDDESSKGLFVLDNGYIITETTMSPTGTGLAGLNYYHTLRELENAKGENYKFLSAEE